MLGGETTQGTRGDGLNEPHKRGGRAAVLMPAGFAGGVQCPTLSAREAASSGLSSPLRRQPWGH
jgi:hypothetical protein